MNKYILGFVSICTAIFSVSYVYSQEADQLDQLRKQASVIQINIKGKNTDGSMTAQQTMTVDGIGEFLLENAQAINANTIYDIYFFRDGRVEDEIKSIKLPYVFKQNFAGLNEGTYQLQFLLVNSFGEVGRVDQTITVRHNP